MIELSEQALLDEMAQVDGPIVISCYETFVRYTFDCGGHTYRVVFSTRPGQGPRVDVLGSWGWMAILQFPPGVAEIIDGILVREEVRRGGQ